MPRQQRYRIPDIPQHLVVRGNDRRACFFDSSDYSRYLALLNEASSKHRCEVHAYVLMTNHVHLLVTPRVCNGIIFDDASRRTSLRAADKCSI